MWRIVQRWWHDARPELSVPPAYGPMRRLCRWQARQLRRLARVADSARAHRAREQEAWIVNVLRHHPLLDDLQRTIRQSADLLHELAPDRFPAS